MERSRAHFLLALPIAVPLFVFVGYGLVSLPGLVAHWGVPIAVLPMLLVWLGVTAVPLVLADRGRMRTAVAGGAVGLVALRGAMAVLVVGRVPPGDAHMYLVLADNLRSGRGFEIFEPFMGVETRALFPPLYPALLALWSFVAGLSTASVLALGLLIDGVAAGLIVTLATALGHRRAGLAAAWLYLVWPSVLLSAPLAQKEGLCVLLALLLALQWVRYVQAERPGIRDATGIGVSAGLLALTQPGELPLAALFGIVALGVGVRRLFVVSIAAIPAAAAATMLPWWVRNAVVFRSFVPLTSAGGYGLWIGNNPDANGHWLPPPDQLYGMPEIAFGKAAAHLAVLWIESHPLAFAKVTVAKALRAWGIAEFGAARFAGMKPAVAASVGGGLFLVSQIAHFALMGTAAVRPWIGRRRDALTGGTRILLLLVLACIAQTLCFGVFFEFGERHRDFATPFLLLLAMWGLEPRAADIAVDGP